MTHIIRLAKLHDTSAIATVLAESWRTTYPGIVAQNYIDQLSVEAQAKRWEHRLSGEAETAAATLVAQEATGSIIGFASGGPIRKPLAGFDAELYAIYIVRTGKDGASDDSY